MRRGLPLLIGAMLLAQVLPGAVAAKPKTTAADTVPVTGVIDPGDHLRRELSTITRSKIRGGRHWRASGIVSKHGDKDRRRRRRNGLASPEPTLQLSTWSTYVSQHMTSAPLTL